MIRARAPARSSPWTVQDLYGTTCADGTNQFGNVFELSPSSGGWTYRDLYDFLRRGGFPAALCSAPLRDGFLRRR